jgi:hypothetical protein
MDYDAPQQHRLATMLIQQTLGARAATPFAGHTLSYVRSAR